jgi:hypothetical protein
VTSPVTVAIDELIGTRTLTQFSELAKKLSDLDQSIPNAQQLSKQLDDVKKIVEAVQSRIESLSKSSQGGNDTTGSNEFSSQQTPKYGPKEYTVKEWIDMDIKRQEDEAKKKNLRNSV